MFIQYAHLRSVLVLLLGCFSLTAGVVHPGWKTVDDNELGNDRLPVIGILTQLLHPRAGPPGPLFIAASYVKWAESGGALVVPLWVNETESYYRDMLSKVNGVLLPGGVAGIPNSPFAQAGQTIYKLVLEANANGTYLPLWASCQGYELLVYAEVHKNVMNNCSGTNNTFNMDFVFDIDQSRLYGQAPRQVLRDLYSLNITANNHIFCLGGETFETSGMDQHYRILSFVSDTVANNTFVASIEHKVYPIYGVQFHPEKTAYEMSTRYHYSHTGAAVRAAQYFAWFFLSEARKNNQRFGSDKELLDALVYNWTPAFSGRNFSSSFEQEYIFDWPGQKRNVRKV